VTAGDHKQDSEADRPFNPLDKTNLGESVADALLARPISELPPAVSFQGAGVYALYYVGNHPLYKPISDLNANDQFHQPIYVGKAVPKGSRKGGYDLNAPPGTVLHARLREHADSIRSAPSLNVSHFRCRYLIVDDIWIPLGEALLIEMFSPIWNRVVDGFGIHDPGAGRSAGQRSKWDTLHPGRAYADKCKPNALTKEQIEQQVKAFLQGHPQ